MSKWDPATIGEVRFTFTYPTPQAAKKAWERAERRVRFISMYRHAFDGDLSRQGITVLAEDDETCRPQVAKARRLLSIGSTAEIETPRGVFEILREQRLETFVAMALQGGGGVRRRRRFGEGGAVGDRTGIHPRRRQG